VAVAEQLNLDVPTMKKPAFEIHGRVAKRRSGFRSRRADRGQQIVSRDHCAHAFAAAAGDRFHDQRIANARGGRDDFGVGRVLRKRRLRCRARLARPISRQARMTRTAISPRLAIKTSIGTTPSRHPCPS
jgi:hypothetical protein